MHCLRFALLPLLPVLSAPEAFSQGPAAECTASLKSGELSVSNAQIDTRWTISEDGLVHLRSLRAKSTGAEWASGTATASNAVPSLTVSQRWTKHVIEKPSLTVEVAEQSQPSSGYRFVIYPGVSAISVTRFGVSRVESDGVNQASQQARASGIETDSTSTSAQQARGSIAVDLNPLHVRLTQVELLDQTDIHNELVFEHARLLQTNESLHLQGNLFTIEDSLTPNGLAILKQAPLPHARPGKAESDLQYDAAHRRLLLSGGSPGASGNGYTITLIPYSGGRAHLTKALHDFQRQVRPYVSGRDGMFLSNTWGDRSRDARINAQFMEKEVTAGARLGVDVIQIDDGWEHGTTKNSARSGGVWNGFWAFDPNFWDVNTQRFPGGLEPVIGMARQHGMGFGLWFAPDSSNDFSNWERDAERLLTIHKTLGVNYFKIDGVKATSTLSEVRLHSLFEKVLEGSGGRVVFDLDVTAEIRPGYFGAMHQGPLFVENRYTDRHSYWPHTTLRNLWMLSQFVDPLRLRVEFLNGARNRELYRDDPLAPAAYPPAYLFATTMMANPLGWFEVSNLPPTYFEEVAPLVKQWKIERARMQAGTIVPIGSAPDGASWTGFLSLNGTGADGYLLVFRENHRSERWSQTLPFVTGENFRLELLGGNGKATVQKGQLDIEIPEALNFAWFRMTAEKK